MVFKNDSPKVITITALNKLNQFKKKYIRVSEENRIGTILSRPNSFTVAKILIPLVFLAFLALFGTYLPFYDLETIIALTTASFLSAIALYFSTERPNPLSLTTIDLIFLLFYFFVGIILVAIFVLGFFPEYYVTVNLNVCQCCGLFKG